MGEIRLDNCCRLCLKEGFSLTNVFSHHSATGDPLYRILNFIYDIKIFENDGLPSQICSPCMWRMIEFDACKKNVRSAEAEIMKLLSQARHDEADEGGIVCSPVNSAVPIKEEIDIVEWEMPVDTFMKSSDSSCVKNSLILEEAVGNVCLRESNSSGNISEIYDGMGTHEEIHLKDVEEKVIPSQEYGSPRQRNKNLVESELSGSVKYRKKLFVCDICRKSVSTKQSLGRHMRVHYDDRPFSCNICDKRFKHPKVRKVHELRHLRDSKSVGKCEKGIKEKPFSCGVCGKNFSSKEGMHRHNNQHTDKYACNSCGKRFVGNAQLKKHSRIHTGEKPFKCEVCFKLFSDKGNLKRHYAVHSSERPYSCDVCDKRFKSKHERSQHEIFHLRKN